MPTTLVEPASPANTAPRRAPRPAMPRFVRLLFIAIVVAGLGTLAVNITSYLSHRQSRIAQLQRERLQLREVIQRLTGRSRRAQLVVAGQTINGFGKVLRTHLLWQEFTIGPHGNQTPLPVRKFTIPGNIVHVDAFVLKFQDKYVEEGNVLRGKSLALFRRIYGESQAPDKAIPLAVKGAVPLAYRAKLNRTNSFERQLWTNIWQLMDHPKMAAKQGLDVVQGQDVYRPVFPGKLYEIDLQNDGGLEFRQREGESALVHNMLIQAARDHTRSAAR